MNNQKSESKKKTSMSTEFYSAPEEYYDTSSLKKIYNTHIQQNKAEYSNEELAKILKSYISVYRNPDGELYIYNYKRHYYVLFKDWLKELIFTELCRLLNITWTEKSEYTSIAIFERSIKKVINEFNKQNAINLQNGVFYLDDGRLESHTPKNTLFTYCCNYSYEANATCERFLEVVDFACCKDVQMKNVLQEIFGYCLSDDIKIQKAFFFVGNGSNGKSLLSAMLTEVVGKEMVSNVSLDSLSQKFSKQGLINKKLNVSNESTHIANTESLKSITGGDKINIQIKYQEDRSMTLHCKILCLLNELPTPDDFSYGYFRRVLVFPFDATVQPNQMDQDLKSKLINELPGILLWCYEGYKRLKSNNYKFTYCKRIEDETKNYNDEQNNTGIFFDLTYEKCPDHRILRSSIYKDYVAWADSVGAEKIPNKKFYNALIAKFKENGSDSQLKIKKIQGSYYVIGYKKRTKSP